MRTAIIRIRERAKSLLARRIEEVESVWLSVDREGFQLAGGGRVSAYTLSTRMRLHSQVQREAPKVDKNKVEPTLKSTPIVAVLLSESN